MNCDWSIGTIDRKERKTAANLYHFFLLTLRHIQSLEIEMLMLVVGSEQDGENPDEQSQRDSAWSVFWS